MELIILPPSSRRRGGSQGFVLAEDARDLREEAAANAQTIPE